MLEIDAGALPRVDRISLRHVALPLRDAFTTSFMTKTERHSIIVEVSGNGLQGYAECVAGSGPYYSPETIGTAWHIMEDYLIPRMLETNRPHPEQVWDLFVPIKGNRMAKAGVEMAYWDFVARSLHIPLAQLLGGIRDRVPVGVSIGIQESPEALVAKVAAHLVDGYKRVKLKIAPGRDVEYVKAVRRRFPDIRLQVDANSAYTLDDIRVFQEMGPMNLLLIEQPLADDDIIDHAKLQQQIKTPICLDESIHSPVDAQHAIDLGSCKIINIKPGRVGGYRQSIDIHDVCKESLMPVWCGGMLETNIGRAHLVALATLPDFLLPGDISASNRYFAEDIAEPDFRLNKDSTLSVPQGEGIGVTPIPERLQEVTIDHIEHRSGRIFTNGEKS